jgi:hypothetical protein
MKPSLGLAGVFLLALVLGLPASRLAAQDAKGKVTEADIKKLAELLTGMLMDPADAKYDARKAKALIDEFNKEFDRIDKLVKPAFLISLPEVWNEVFIARRPLVKAPSGLGRIDEKTAPGDVHYALVLPNGFDLKKRYPLIVVLHDKSAKDEKVTGAKYLEEVWMKSIPKEERDKFIIIAPNLGSASGIDAQIKIAFQSLYDVVGSYPVDNDRMYLDGSGDGGELAWQAALGKPHFWAGVAIRSALPRTLQGLPNCGALPVQLHLRAGSPQSSGAAHDNFEKARKDLPIEVKEHTAPDKPARSAFAADTIAESTPEIAAFFAKKARNLAPKRFTFIPITEGDLRFKECYWANLLKYEDKISKLVAVVDEKENAIDLATENIESFKIYLSDRLVNLDRPVKVTVNGKEHTNRLFSRDLKTFIQYYKKNPRDPGIQPCAILDIAVSPTVESKPSAPESAPAPAPPK